MRIVRSINLAFMVAVVCGALACDDDDQLPPDVGTGTGGADQPGGTTAIVTIVNPVENEGHTTGAPASVGTERNGIDIDAEPGENDITENDGLALVGVPVGPVDLFVGAAPALPHTVIAAGDLYDAAIGYDGSASAFFPNTPIRYAVGSGRTLHYYTPEDDIAVIGTRLEEDDVIVILRPGTYVGNLSVDGTNTLLFAEGWSERAVALDGTLTINGTGVRVRGLTVTGDLISNGNTFGISFSVVRGTTDIKGNGGAFLRNVFCGSATVPSSNATLLDNYGVPPLMTLPPLVCE